jgi:hypothetical protein
MTPTLTIQRLSRFPKTSKNDELRFTSGVNVMVGDKDSGKTTWLRMLDYLLGDDEKPAVAFGESVATTYDSIEAEFHLASETCVLRRSWAESALKSKMTVNDQPINVADLSDLILGKLSIPRLNFPKGDPFSERKWPALTFRTLLRHIYRQERFWSDLADKQPEPDQHACLALFLGVAEALFPPEFGELVKKQKLLDKLQFTREAHQKLLDQIASDLLRQKEISVAVTDTAVAATQERLRAELMAIESQRAALLEAIAAKAQAEVGERAHIAKTQLDAAAVARTALDAEAQTLAHRLTELKTYAQMLSDEVDRFGRAESVNGLIAQLRVTHCPVCDQEVMPIRDTKTCYLCHRAIPGTPIASANQRIEFEETQLKEEKGEIETLIANLEAQLASVDLQQQENQRAQQRLETDLRPARQFALGLLPPDLTILDQQRGRLNEQLDTLARITKSVETQKSLTKQIEDLLRDEDRLKEELAAVKADAELQKVSLLFEERVNEYLNEINSADPSRWSHGRATFRLRERSFDFHADEKLGATSQALFLFAYHYALLSLVADTGCHYPGIVIVDFPLRLADGASIRDKENYLVEPFVKLCAKPNMKDTQFIAAGQSFENLKNAHTVSIFRKLSAT